MTFYNSVVFICVIYVINLCNYVSALTKEDIVGGFIAEPGIFNYQVSIQTRKNLSDIFTPYCGGSIVDEYFIISAASCFVTRYGDLRQKSFSIFAGSTDLKDPNGIRVDIDTIYLPGFKQNYTFYNIALLKLRISLSYFNNVYLNTVILPLPGQSFVEQYGVITGFGYGWIRSYFHPIIGIVIEGGAESYLKYGFAKVLPDKDCQRNFPGLFTDHYMCGLMLTNSVEEIWGFCLGDAGSPLVYEGVLVGIAAKSPANCENSIKGGIYTKVSIFAEFIYSIGQGIIPSDTLVYSNRMHISYKDIEETIRQLSNTSRFD